MVVRTHLAVFKVPTQHSRYMHTHNTHTHTQNKVHLTLGTVMEKKGIVVVKIGRERVNESLKVQKKRWMRNAHTSTTWR